METLRTACRSSWRNSPLIFAILAESTLALASSSSVNLQRPHVERSPTETLQHLGEESKILGIQAWDVYGDFTQAPDASFLRRFEAEIARELGMEDAVFLPSGGMAQSIALLIHAKEHKNSNSFACHHTSHLLLHEQSAYSELLRMNPIVISTQDQANGISVPPMAFADVEEALKLHADGEQGTVATLILELPHREIGGKLTPWKDVVRMQKYCHKHGIKFHLDGARIFEATTGYDKSLQEITSVFDTVYISFYKGLGGMAGAMLLGSNDFCGQARVWLRRFGGNLYTLLPYAVSGWSGFRRQWKLEGRKETDHLLSFRQKKQKLVGLVQALTGDADVSKVLAFDPAIPETNMVHGYLRSPPEECSRMLDTIEKNSNIRVLTRLYPVMEEEPAYQHGFRSKFEWPMGEGNGKIADGTFLEGWKAFSKGLLRGDRSV